MTTTINADNGVSSGSAGLKYSSDSSGVLALQTNGTTAVTVDTSQNVSLAGTLTTSSRGIAKASMPAGSVLQVVTGSTSTQVTNSTSTYTDTGVTATITPTSATSKILILTQVQGIFKSGDNNSNRVNMQLFRGATSLDIAGAVLFSSGTSFYFRATFGHSYYDAPATTSATTYKWQFNNAENTASVAVQKDSNSGASQIILMEIAV